jgi:DNA-binding LytR/AlgR family response regulator
MKCIVIDDDPVSRTLIEKYAQKTKILDFIGAYANPVEAVNDNKLDDVDLIFVDIEMPEMSGIDFMKSFKNLPLVIVISAKEKYAIESLDLEAVDYLLKPIEYPRFLKSVQKAKVYKEASMKKEDKGIFIKDGGSTYIRFRFEDIIWIEALENYVLIVTENERHTVHFTMKSLEMQLPEKHFLRVHRSYIVNLDKINSIEDNYVVIKYNGKKKTFPIAKTVKDTLLNRIKIISK